MKTMAGASAFLMGSCVSEFGSRHSYASQIINDPELDTVGHWVDVILQQTRDQRVAPPRAAYNFAMPMAAGFLAANGITRHYEDPYGLGQGPRTANPEVAYGVAFGICAAEVFQQPFVVERSKFLKRFPDGASKSEGIEWGKKVGKAILKMRTNDGSEPSKVNYYLGRYQRRDDVLKWSPTGPFYSEKPGPAFDSFERGLFPGQGKIKPWTMSSGSQFRANDFYDVHSGEFAEAYDQVYKLGGKDSKFRTKDQAEIAIFWEDGPWGVTPPGRFIFLALQLLKRKPMSFMERARVFALLGMTQCDASISAWDSKYTHDILRPESAIRLRSKKIGAQDPRIVQQRNWQSLIPTPNFPAYTSGHSTFGAAGAEIIALAMGTGNMRFSSETPDLVIWPQLRGVKREFTSIHQAAEENGMSRIYGGVHWMKDHTQAMWAGKNIARQAYKNMFKKIS